MFIPSRPSPKTENLTFEFKKKNEDPFIRSHNGRSLFKRYSLYTAFCWNEKLYKDGESV
ncbi:hypothetical protein YC2023_032738 [Brassica napus]